LLIKPLLPDSFAQVRQIADAELGRNYLSKADLTAFVEESDLAIGSVALWHGQVVGFCLARVMERSDLAAYLHVSDKKLPSFPSLSGRVCVIKTIVVDSGHQQHGIGHRLVADCIKTARERQIGEFCSVAWKSGQTINIDGVLTSFGMKNHREIPDYWTADSLAKGFSCPTCGNPCHCVACLYFGVID
jgi:GNAT superfamily N-acetyltransferase